MDDAEVDEDQAESDRVNREGLVHILRGTGEPAIELYGVWDGDFEEAPEAFEEVSLQMLLEAEFQFKERGFYRVRLNP
jgi:hypothetical protein